MVRADLARCGEAERPSITDWEEGLREVVTKGRRQDFISEMQRDSVSAEFYALPLYNEVLLPFAVLPVELDLREKHSEVWFTSFNQKTEKELFIATVPFRGPRITTEEKWRECIGKIGVMGLVLHLTRSPGTERAAVVLEGQQRFQVVDCQQKNGVPVVQVKWISTESGSILEEDKKKLISRTKKLIEMMSQKRKEESIYALVESLEKMAAGEAADAIGCVLASSYREKEVLLHAIDIPQRVQLATRMVERAMQLVEAAISAQKAHSIEVHAKDEIQDLMEKIKQKNPPREVMEIVRREVKKIQRMNEMHPSYSMARIYLETLATVPFNQFTPEAVENIQHAKRALDSGHFGLDNAKKRILEYVAVRKLKQQSIRGPILCFVGPPGVGMISLFSLLQELKCDVGKTSLAKGMAEALGRMYVRVSLGGVRDEAEIRGHRRTYIGSMPGRIINGLCQIGKCDCVMLLDELDKMGQDFRGNPAAALLEVLDPEQNKSFIDTYLGVPVDLSHVIFLATANTLVNLPAALLDRLEVIPLTGYTLYEKLKIAQRHLIPKVVTENGLEALFEAGKFEFPILGLDIIIQNYTMEVGVRSLERCLSSICRYCATMLVQRIEKMESFSAKEKIVSLPQSTPNSTDESQASAHDELDHRSHQWKLHSQIPSLPLISTSVFPDSLMSSNGSQLPVESLKSVSRPQKPALPLCSLEKIVVDQELIVTVLGPPIHHLQSPVEQLKESGVAAGLVWTPLGGSVQYIECSMTNWHVAPEQGELKLTGQLGEVLEESAQIAMSWIKANSSSLKFPANPDHPECRFQNCDVHVHLPSGGIQKDGPSAGITLAVALISLFSGRSVRSDTAMTGELSLRGMVLPIGGLREKLMGAYQAGLKRVIIPIGNKPQIQHDVPKEITQNLEICPAQRLEDVLLLAFNPPYSLQKRAKL